MSKSRIVWTLVAALVCAAGLLSPARARISDGEADMCWVPDNEFPVPCNEDDI